MANKQGLGKCFSFLLVFVSFLFINCKINSNIVNINTPLAFDSLPSELIYRIKGNVIYLNKGTFVVKKSLTVPSNFSLVGNKTVLNFTNENSSATIEINGKTNVKISNINFVGQKLRNNMDGATLTMLNYKNIIDINNSNNISISNCTFTESYGTGIKIHDCNIVKIDLCVFENIGVPTPKGIPYSSDAVFVGAYKNTTDVIIKNSKFINIGSRFPSMNPPNPNDGDGVHILGAGNITQVSVVDNIFEYCSARAVKIQSGSNYLVSDNLMNNCYSAVVMAMGAGIANVTIKNNIINRSGFVFSTDGVQPGITLQGLSITGNKIDSSYYFFRTNGTSAVDDCIISKNIVNSVDIFFVAGRFLNSKIMDNKVLKFNAKKDKSFNMAIFLNEESKNVIIENNNFGKTIDSDYIIENRSNYKGSILER